MDIIKVHMNSDTGINIIYPVPSLTPYSYCKQSQASRRRSKLLWKRKRGRALRNKILFWVFFIPICVIEFIGFLGFFGILLANSMMDATLGGIWIAIVIIFAWLITYSYLDDIFETDPNYLK